MTVLVTGATGLIGRALVAELRRMGASVRAVSRARDTGGLPVDEVVADTSSLDGIREIFVHPRAVGADVGGLVSRARRAGVRRLVVLSAINVEQPFEHQPSRLRGDRNAEVEAAVVASGLEVVVLRCSEFAANTFGTIGAQLRSGSGDVVRGAYPWATEATIDERDIGEVAAHALLRSDLVGRRLVLTGPHALTLPARVDQIAAATGRRIRFVEVDPPTAVAGLVAAGLPRPFAETYLAQQGKPTSSTAQITHDVDHVLGRRGRTFASWAADHAHHFTSIGV